MNISVIPAIIPEDYNDLRAHLARLAEPEVKEVLAAEAPARVQIDVMDGAFAPTKSWPFAHDTGEFDALLSQDEGLPYWKEFDFEIDMMVIEPERHISDWVVVGAAAIIIHASSTDAHARIREELHAQGVEMGIAFRPSDEVSGVLVEMADFVQLMGNDKIGYHGVDLDEHTYERARTLREKYPDLDIAVDIGVDGETAEELKEAGVNKLVSGSYIFDSMEIRDSIQRLRA